VTGSAFPPVSSRTVEIDQLVGLFASVCDGRTAIYVSTPLTTGKRLSEWSTHSGRGPAHPEYDQGLRVHVVEPNRADARLFVADRRRATGRIVIDPGALDDVPGWTQNDYRAFWGRVIERYASTVVFREGWEHSSGCSYEFLVSLQTGAETFDAELRPLSAQRGLSLLRDAIDECDRTNSPAAFLSSVANALSQLKQKGVSDQ